MIRQLFSPIIILILFAVTTLGFQSCLEDKCDAKRTYVQFNPVYLKGPQFRVDISATQARPLENPGKIYVYKNYLLINELREGIHVFDNTDPNNPVEVSFIEIPGNVDMAIYNDNLYADSYVDFLTIDIQDVQNPVLLDRQTDVFNLLGNDPERGYLVYYNETDITIDIDCSDVRFDNGWFGGINGGIFVDAETASDGSASGNAGIGGSMARFTISQGFLYTIDSYILKTWNLNSPANPIMVDEEQVGWNIETIFPYKDMLFLGSTSGMYIYNTQDPANPSYSALFQHANACDPVVVENDIAFITLRDGTRCQEFTNQLDVVDVSNVINPKFIKSYPMDHPHGLAVRNSILYLCEGDYGLKVFDVSDLENIDKNKLDAYDNMNGFDVISLKNDLLLMIGSDGFYQFDSSDPKNLVQLSHIPIAPK
jgi:hypothetical protein